jgi:hypothetical protein
MLPCSEFFRPAPECDSGVTSAQLLLGPWLHGFLDFGGSASLFAAPAEVASLRLTVLSSILEIFPFLLYLLNCIKL